jgi:hypothetical protein
VNFLPAGKVDMDKPMNIAKLRADLVTGQHKHLSTGDSTPRIACPGRVPRRTLTEIRRGVYCTHNISGKDPPPAVKFIPWSLEDSFGL